MNAIELTNITKTLGEFRLHLPTLTVEQGLVTGFIGENGAGKTTTIKLMMNMLFADQGSIKILGLDMPKDIIKIKDQIGFIADPIGFPERLTLKQLHDAISPFYSQWDERIYRQYMNRFHLDDGKKYTDLSKGMKKQFDLITALSHHPKLLILDEPTANLDPLARDELLNILLEHVTEEESTIFFSTHITSDLDKIADHLIFLNHGEILLEDNKDDLLDNHRIIRGKTALLISEIEKYCLHVTKNSFGFEALCKDWQKVYDLLGDEAVYDKATLNDIFIAYIQQSRQ